ncbi:MAG: HIT domain-containing protein [Gammaproteobacteria bacterium]|nr:HIT domain-containing protein [Gammaproteobacteria bacterium]
MSDCIFCKIVGGLLPSKTVWSNEKFIAFWDIHPKAKVHILVIPKHHIPSFNDFTNDDQVWLGEYMIAIKSAAESLGLTHYQVRFHNGAASGQEIFHLHAHILQN